MDKNIVLIGMPGAGKSTTGLLLAKTLNMPFVDTDLIIQQREGRLLQEIIDYDGIGPFLSIEEDAILQMSVRGYIIATGGSAVYREAAMRHLKKNGILLYLQLEYGEIEKRINNIKSRGIVMDKGRSLIDLYNERVPLYEKYADLTIRCSGKHIEEVVDEIQERMRGNKKFF
ncbi:MAG: shikimate kinase [Clostridiales bacterium]|jgi:shikimate kinase|nr:shikimate kinase [Eubacteriales bacterium]MDH7567721.1 shikimate kinase [Clostridiales bacterium]